MPRAILTIIVLPLLVLAACETTAEREAQFDNRLREMAGTPEAGLLNSMGRIPDSSYQLEDGSKVLQWRWDTSYIDPGSPPFYYRRFGGWGWGWNGGWWTPVGGFPPTLVRQGCIVEWTMVGGSARGYRWQGAGCAKVSP